MSFFTYLVEGSLTVNFGKVVSHSHSNNVRTQSSPRFVIQLVEEPKWFLNAEKVIKLGERIRTYSFCR